MSESSLTTNGGVYDQFVVCLMQGAGTATNMRANEGVLDVETDHLPARAGPSARLLRAQS